MGRPENPIGNSGPVAELATRLRMLRDEAGLTLRELARLTGCSIATLSVAMSGRELPTWRVTHAIVRVCHGDVESCQESWRRAAGVLSVPATARVPAKVRFERRESDEDLPLRGQQLAGPPPVPVACETVADFMDCLLRVKIWAGNPSMRLLARRAEVPASTLQDALRGKKGKLPTLEMLIAFLTACDINDAATVGEWVFTWRRLKFDEIKAPRPGAKRHLASVG